jgi:hypothetical protein
MIPLSCLLYSQNIKILNGGFAGGRVTPTDYEIRFTSGSSTVLVTDENYGHFMREFSVEFQAHYLQSVCRRPVTVVNVGEHFTDKDAKPMHDCHVIFNQLMLSINVSTLQLWSFWHPLPQLGHIPLHATMYFRLDTSAS